MPRTKQEPPLDECEALPKCVSADLIYHSMVFATAAQIEGREFCGLIIARDYSHAEQRALERGLGEVVCGQIERIIE